MIKLIDNAFIYHRTVLATLTLVLLFGAIAYVNIPKEADPDINIPIIYVQMSHDGISPEDSESLLIRPLEQELRGIEGVKEISASGYEGGASVTLQFDAGFDVEKALDDVREKVEHSKPDLPEGTDEPTIHEVNFSLFPVVLVTLSGEVPERSLLKLARDLKDELESIASVLEVKIAGDREEMVEVLIDPVSMESYGLSPRTAMQLVATSNLLIAAGAQDTGYGRFSLKVPGLLEATKDIMNLPIKTEGDAVVRLSDVAEIRRTYKDPDNFARINGRSALVLEVVKRSGENIIDTIENVRRVVWSEKKSWPKSLQETLHVSFAQDKSREIGEMLNDLQNNVIVAILLVLVIIIAFLGVRTAGLVGLAIPGSFLTGILVLYALGMTINVVVLFALILAVGMLVDGAIVVTEFADRKMIEGESKKSAYSMAAKRMSWPIIASTATTLAAFVPLVFWPGVVGEFMKFLPLTLLATLSASLLMALIFIPTIGGFIGMPSRDEPSPPVKIEGGNFDGFGKFTVSYIGILEKALKHPGKIIISAFVLLGSVQFIYGTLGKGVEFFPNIEPDFAKIQVRARGNLSVFEMDKLMREVEERILQIGREREEFKTVYLRSGKEKNTKEAPDIIGVISIEFTDWESRRKADEILNEIAKRTSDLLGVIVDRRLEGKGPPVGKPVAVELSSRFPELLSPSIEKVYESFYAIDGLINIEDSRPLPGIDWEMRVDRAQAMKFGASVDSIGQAIQMVTTGIRLGGYRPNDADEEIDIQARYPIEYRTINQLDHIRVKTDGGRVPISNFVNKMAKSKTGIIKRSNGRRVMTIKADVADGMLANDKVSELQALFDIDTLDPRLEISFKGEDEEKRKAEAFLGKAFLAAIFLMAIILVTQFNSFYSALLILTSVIMSTTGVFIGLLVTGQPFGIVMSGIGVIALAGIVVNNNIVLIDTYDHLKKTVSDSKEAILRTGAQRLRPVLLTTITTILGLLPMVSGVNIDFITREISVGAPSMQWWGQLSTAIVFGLGFATLLTLIVTPCALMIKENINDWLNR